MTGTEARGGARQLPILVPTAALHDAGGRAVGGARALVAVGGARRAMSMWGRLSSISQSVSQLTKEVGAHLLDGDRGDHDDFSDGDTAECGPDDAPGELVERVMRLQDKVAFASVEWSRVLAHDPFDAQLSRARDELDRLNDRDRQRAESLVKQMADKDVRRVVIRRDGNVLTGRPYTRRRRSPSFRRCWPRRGPLSRRRSRTRPRDPCRPCRTAPAATMSTWPNPSFGRRSNRRSRCRR